MRIAVIGRSEILYNLVLYLLDNNFTITCIITSKEAPEYRKKRKDFEDLSKNLGIPFHSGSQISKFKNTILSSKSDIAVSFNYTGIIPEKIIKLFKLGILNAHGGDLPKYRGNACQAWAILNAEKHIGLCIHKMIGDELDSGDIIERDYLSININTKVTEAWDWMEERIPSMMLNAINKLTINPKFILEKQSRNAKDILRCYPRTPEDGRIIWEKNADDVLRLINSSNKPYSGAFCYFEGEKIIIWDAYCINETENFCAVPGQVKKIGRDYIDVACGVGTLRIRLIQIGDKSILPSTVINSIRKRLK